MNNNANYSESLKREAAPIISAFVQGLRELGYEPATAIADLIDNSITADATNITVDFLWAKDKSIVSILDDGVGMTDDEIHSAMRLGTKSPWVKRHPKDLGRFGLGLKTASFSQGKKFTVASKKIDGSISYWTWDLDHVESTGCWDVIQHISDPSLLTKLHECSQGTLVIWEKLDRLLETPSEYDEQLNLYFYKIADKVKRHLSIVFHRFIEKGRITLIFNGNKVVPWDPFLRGNPSTQVIADERLLEGDVIVKGYILPHRSKIDSDTYLLAQGPEGWDAQQGFYVYRNERLLIGADWFGFYRKESHCKLARIMIDIPNHLDKEWKLDVKKSKASPPVYLIKDLKRISAKVRSQAEIIYRHRGIRLQRSNNNNFEFVWDENVKHNKIFYKINRNHSFVKNFIDTYSGQKKLLAQFIRIIEETVPVKVVLSSDTEQKDNFAAPFEHVPTFEITEMMKVLYNGWIKNGYSPERAKEKLHSMQPFSDFPQLIQSISDDGIAI